MMTAHFLCYPTSAFPVRREETSINYDTSRTQNRYLPDKRKLRIQKLRKQRPDCACGNWLFCDKSAALNVENSLCWHIFNYPRKHLITCNHF